MSFVIKTKPALNVLAVGWLALSLFSCANDSETKNIKLGDSELNITSQINAYQRGNETYTFNSPNSRIQVFVSWQSGLSPKYTVSFDNKVVLLPSAIDLIEENEQQVEHDLVLLSKESMDKIVELPWGQFNQTNNQYNGVRFRLINKKTKESLSVLELRAFNDAVAFRHVFEASDKANNTSLTEKTHFHFAEDASIWSYNGMKPTKHTESVLNSSSEKVRIPALVLANDFPTIALQEASRLETGVIDFETIEGSAQVAVVSEPISNSNNPSATSWRVLQIADKPADLLTSQTLINLSPESQIEDTSWIKTGKSFWDWRVRGQEYGDHKYALDNESLRRMINFAAVHNMQYVMVDANWYGPEHKVDSDPFTEIDGLNIKGLIKQANEKGVGFILYLNDKASVNHDLDKLFETWSSWGAAGVKYGFMKKKGKDKVIKTLNIVELAAKHQLLINFHDGPIIPSGLRKTWPNWVTREAVHAQADGRETFTPSGFVRMAHVNGLTGPLDMSNGFFKLNGLKESRKYVKNDVNSTVANEVARALIIYSGLIIFPDAPEEYIRKKDLFEFLQKMPATWDESRVLSSDINHYIVTARRSGEDWFVGASINEAGGNLPLKLDFLTENKTYIAKIYADASDAHYIDNREAYQISSVEVRNGDELTMSLAPGGGQAILISPKLEVKTSER